MNAKVAIGVSCKSMGLEWYLRIGYTVLMYQLKVDDSPADISTVILWSSLKNCASCACASAEKPPFHVYVYAGGRAASDTPPFFVSLHLSYSGEPPLSPATSSQEVL